jgi:hypothetical protein
MVSSNGITGSQPLKEISIGSTQNPWINAVSSSSNTFNNN